ncbi:hypothetical protein A2962_02080 [Candidatus Woesebacteria bacterium RIFCSPLOWO2_01_FULL_39_61]|uniref:Uncharacterized protein n=1 Tax=Candidatus Woesebacteria bacterium RIFCSPHIGHO2_02_FULL_39_13 TaxID=1802505 RepID=A0A1F7YYA3_9BACT|nr:MAG: hypothetical protein A2692_03080 [Candidatus Woesebacteria bacterium RIFCSPHIGHO2_01_FULL_39_95]OGM32336.1 MAG: hypothetical protein A3D01_04715 [Candidatus Woesebacteria bacterium RIFCSPHIGHO2_02_FULL_39_13]OGM37022.1 MAG: hypothetical protein A3E13_03675 [Candidatus Woesebacteria bacterium RIFCSPHIGHO2_12_FULL_40_20]OGM67932.1 MAG: hypothetical protein A2962_02080 [Candidatus Woesebacteria bacterium RIFCSPLOWO2_01_FULL_39_61]OGM72225.1 MAG: hypothetical protein A3H19_02225 [Candidatus
MEIKKIANSWISLLAGFIVLFLIIYDFNVYVSESLGGIIASLLFSSLTVFAAGYFVYLNTKEKIFYTLVVAITNQILLKTPFSFLTEIISWSSLIALIILFIADLLGIRIAGRNKKT